MGRLPLEILDFAIAILAQKMKETVIFMMSVKMVFTVEQITAQMHLTLIVVIPHLL